MELDPKEIAEAADLIREHARTTSGGGESLTWFEADADLRGALQGTYGMYERGDCDVYADARWIADMSPSLGVHLADLIDLINAAYTKGKPSPELIKVRAICQEILDNAVCARIYQ